PFVIITAPTTYLYQNSSFNHQGMELSYNTRLPYLGETKRAYRVMNPDGSHSWIDKSDASQYDSVTDIPQPTGETLVETGKMFVCLHYLWAGMSGFGLIVLDLHLRLCNHMVSLYLAIPVTRQHMVNRLNLKICSQVIYCFLRMKMGKEEYTTLACMPVMG